jgi:hypothetical protein
MSTGLNDFIRQGAGRIDVTSTTTGDQLNAAIRRARDGEPVATEPAEPDTAHHAEGSGDGGKGLEVNQGGPKPPTFDNLIRDLRG